MTVKKQKQLKKKNGDKKKIVTHTYTIYIDTRKKKKLSGQSKIGKCLLHLIKKNEKKAEIADMQNKEQINAMVKKCSIITL